MNYLELMLGLSFVLSGLYIAYMFILPSGSAPLSLLISWPKSHPAEFKIWLAFAALIITCICLLLYCDNEVKRLSRVHEIAPGTFLTYGGNHGYFDYKFDAYGTTYKGRDSSEVQQTGNIVRGEAFQVYYDPSNPNINIVCDPVVRLKNENTVLILIGVIVLCVSAIIVHTFGNFMRTSSANLRLSQHR